MKELKLDATIENLDTVAAFLEENLEEMGCPMRAQMQLSVAVEEIYVNIAHYAYGEQSGYAVVQLEEMSDPKGVELTFIDGGTPFDPLAKPDPDVTLSAEERQIGGLGIYMVKKTMDEVWYEYKNGQNLLHLRKKF